MRQRLFVPLENLSCTNPKIYSGSLGSLYIFGENVSTSGNHLVRRVESLCSEARDRNRWDVSCRVLLQVILLVIFVAALDSGFCPVVRYTKTLLFEQDFFFFFFYLFIKIHNLSNLDIWWNFLAVKLACWWLPPAGYHPRVS